MQPAEFWLIYEGRKPPKMYGSMTEAEVEDLYEWMYGAEDRNTEG